MARYLVLSFEDNEEAEEATKYIKGYFPRAETIALIAQPTQFHDSTECKGLGKRFRPYTRGKKFGWWVCAACKKPSKPSGETEEAQAENLMRQTVSQGVNLIEEAPNQFASVFDKGWGAMGRGAGL